MRAKVERRMKDLWKANYLLTREIGEVVQAAKEDEIAELRRQLLEIPSKVQQPWLK